MKKLIIIAISALILASCSARPKVGSAVVVLVDEGVNQSPSDFSRKIKTGEACATNILGLVATGDASIEAAKFNGNIKQVVSIDKDIKGLAFYVIFARSCTVVTGY